MVSNRLILVLFGLFCLEQTTDSVVYKCNSKKRGVPHVICGFKPPPTACIDEDWQCDSYTDCLDGSDESFCQYLGIVYKYEYDYVGDVFFPDRSDGLQVKARVVLLQKRKARIREAVMMLKQPKLIQKAKPGKNLLRAAEKRSWEKPIEFDILNSGIIANLRTETNEKDDILNIKKSIASLFQIKIKEESEYDNYETDPTGSCVIKYKKKNQTIDMRYKSNRKNTSDFVYTITKTNDYLDCTNRPTYTFTNVDPVSCSDDKKLPFLKSRMMTSCVLYHHKSKRFGAPFIQSCQSQESHELKTLVPDQARSQFVVLAERKLTFVKLSFSSAKSLKTRIVRKNSRFSFNGLTKPSKISDPKEDIDEIKGILDQLTTLAKKDTMAYDLMDFVVPKIYLHLVIHLRWRSKPSTFAKIYSKFFKGTYRYWLESALPFFGTEASGVQISKRILSGEINGMGAIKLFSRLGVVGDPDVGLLDHIWKLCRNPKLKNATDVQSTCWLAFGSLIRDYCRGKVICPRKYIKALTVKYNKAVLDKDPEKLMIALKTIGNAGQREHLSLLLGILTNYKLYNNNAVMIAAIESLRRMPLIYSGLRKAQVALLNTFTNKSISPEIRMVAFGALMNTGPPQTMVIRLTNSIRTDVNPLIKQYVYTFLKTETKAACAKKKSRLASIDLLNRLANIPNQEIDPRKSFSFSSALQQTGILKLYREIINLEMVHTHASNIPRFFKFKNTMNMPGLEFDHMEFKLRQREMSSMLRDLIGPYGLLYNTQMSMDSHHSEKDGYIPEVYKRLQETIHTTTPDDKPFQATLSSKLFGAEISYMMLNEKNHFIQSLIKNGTIKIDKDWWTNSLKAGMHFDVSASDLLFNSMVIIATSTGLPLHLRATMAGSLAFDFNITAKGSPMFNLWSMSSQPKEITGTYKQCHSVSTYTNGRMYWFYRDTRMGYQAHHSVSTRCMSPVDRVSFTVNIPSRTLNVTEKVTKSKYVYSNSSLSITHFGRVKGINVYERKVKIQNVQANTGMPNVYGPMMGGGKADKSPGQVPFMGGARPGSNIPGLKPGLGLKKKQRKSIGIPNLGSNMKSSGKKSLGKAGSWPKPGKAKRTRRPKPGHGVKSKGKTVMPGKVTKSASSAQEASASQPSCITFGKDYWETCSNTNHGETAYVETKWHEPGKQTVDNIEIMAKNLTSDSDKELRFQVQFLLNGVKKNKKALEELRVDFNTTGLQGYTPMDPIPKYIGFSVKAVHKQNGKIKRVGCLKSGLRMRKRRLDVRVGWGKNCTHYTINTTLKYNGLPNKARLDINSTWKSLPPELERLTCPAKMLKKMMNAGMGGHGGMGGLPGGKQGRPQGKPHGVGLGQGQGQGQGGVNRRPGRPMNLGQGGMNLGQGGINIGQGGMNLGQGGINIGQRGINIGQGGIGLGGIGQGGIGQGGIGLGGIGLGGMGQGGIGQGGIGQGGIGQGGIGLGGMGQGGIGQGGIGQGGIGLGGINSGQGGIGQGGMGQGGMNPGGGLGALPCLTSLNISVSIKNDNRVVLKGFPTPSTEIVNFTMPVNITKELGSAIDIINYGLTETCEVYQDGGNVMTFDQQSYPHKISAGCPYVLAKDCSKKDLFVVFLKRNAKDKREVTLVVKDKKSVLHDFVVKPDLSVVHNGTAVKFTGDSQLGFAGFPQVCRLMKSNVSVAIKCLAGVTVVATQKKLEVKVSPWYFGRMCGMCGNNNRLPSDDISNSNSAESFVASWVVPGKSCNSECPLVHRPESEKMKKRGKLCITTSPVTRCAPKCTPTITTAKFGYHCINDQSNLAKKTLKQISNKKFQKVINAFENKSKFIEKNTEVHVDCICNCPKS